MYFLIILISTFCTSLLFWFRHFDHIQGKADDQLSWRVPRNEKLARLREKLRQQKEQVSQGPWSCQLMAAVQFDFNSYLNLWQTNTYIYREGENWEDVSWPESAVRVARISNKDGIIESFFCLLHFVVDSLMK